MSVTPSNDANTSHRPSTHSCLQFC